MGHQYRLPAGPRADRLNAIDPTPDLEAEIKLCRLIAEELSATANPLAAHICAVIGRLAERDQAMKTERRALITAGQLHALMVWLGDALHQTALEFLPGDHANRFVDRFSERFSQAFAKLRDSGALPKLLSETAEPQQEPAGLSESSPLPLGKLES